LNVPFFALEKPFTNSLDLKGVNGNRVRLVFHKNRPLEPVGNPNMKNPGAHFNPARRPQLDAAIQTQGATTPSSPTKNGFKQTTKRMSQNLLHFGGREKGGNQRNRLQACGVTTVRDGLHGQGHSYQTSLEGTRSVLRDSRCFFKRKFFEFGADNPSRSSVLKP